MSFNKIESNGEMEKIARDNMKKILHQIYNKKYNLFRSTTGSQTAKGNIEYKDNDIFSRLSKHNDYNNMYKQVEHKGEIKNILIHPLSYLRVDQYINNMMFKAMNIKPKNPKYKNRYNYKMNVIDEHFKLEPIGDKFELIHIKKKFEFRPVNYSNYYSLLKKNTNKVIYQPIGDCSNCENACLKKNKLCLSCNKKYKKCPLCHEDYITKRSRSCGDCKFRKKNGYSQRKQLKSMFKSFDKKPELLNIKYECNVYNSNGDLEK